MECGKAGGQMANHKGERKKMEYEPAVLFNKREVSGIYQEVGKDEP